ncbi:helix-turn-helix domain-containing protein [Stutzerimonas kunmingensis]|uniref:helix-turn-helix domain-containing protein n=1 Tax=Stutzerimonas kunmingensis TaxID=1211807 RepID=UPI0035236A29
MLPSHLLMWPDMLLYFGPLRHLDRRVNGAAVLMVGLYRPLVLQLTGTALPCRAVVVPAGMAHAVDAQGGVLAKLFVERDSELYGRFVQRFTWRPGQCALPLHDPVLIDTLTALYEEAPSKEQTRQTLLALMPAADNATDAGRLTPVFELLRQEGDVNHALAQAASLVHLSPSRMAHLFRAETGMSYRGFRIWKRLLLAAEYMQRTDCLTRAAVDAGFADASHFSNCYKRYIGASPAQVFRSLQRFER